MLWMTLTHLSNELITITPDMSYNLTNEELVEFQKKLRTGMPKPQKSYGYSTSLLLVMRSRLPNDWKKQLNKACRIRNMQGNRYAQIGEKHHYHYGERKGAPK